MHFVLCALVIMFKINEFLLPFKDWVAKVLIWEKYCVDAQMEKGKFASKMRNWQTLSNEANILSWPVIVHCDSSCNTSFYTYFLKLLSSAT